MLRVKKTFKFLWVSNYKVLSWNFTAGLAQLQKSFNLGTGANFN